MNFCWYSQPELKYSSLFSMTKYFFNTQLYPLEQRLANSCDKEPDSKYSRLRGPCSLCHNYSTLLVQEESSHTQSIKKWCVCVPAKFYLQNRWWAGFACQAIVYQSLLQRHNLRRTGGTFLEMKVLSEPALTKAE